MDDVNGNLFIFVLLKCREVLKMLVRLFRIKQVSLEKRLAGAIYKEKKKRNGDKKNFTTTKKKNL